MIKHIASRSVLVLVSMFILSAASAQVLVQPRVAVLSSHLSDYLDPTEDWPYGDPNLFGESVAIWNETAVVGMPAINDGRGRVAIFQRGTSGWQRTGTLVPSDAAPGQGFGHTLTIKDDTIAVGGGGAAYVFKLIDGTWRQTQKLTLPATHTGLNFPSSLAYNDNLLVAGARSQGTATSAVYLFQLSSAGTFVQRTRLLSPARVSDDLFGTSIALTDTRLLVGAPEAGPNYTGAAYLYTRTSTDWRLQQKLMASDPQRYAEFGNAVAVGDGVLAIGAYTADSDSWDDRSVGAVYLFGSESGAFIQQQKLTSPDVPPYDGYVHFGYEIAISGSRLAIAAEEAAFGSFYPRGAVLTYELNEAQAQLTGVAYDFITADSIALASDTLLVGITKEYEPSGIEVFGEVNVYDVRRGECLERSDSVLYSEFESAADGWTPLAGTWSVSNGSYGNSASADFVASLAVPTVNQCYSIGAKVFLSWTGATGNRGGFLYDYQDAGNYREVTLSRSASNRQLLTLAEVRNGIREVVSSQEGDAWQPGAWVELWLQRQQDVTRVYVNVVQQFEVTQAPLGGTNRVGLLGRWNLVRFDDVGISKAP